MTQLSFDLPVTVALGEGAFYVSAANADAHDMVTGAVGWPQNKLVVVGPGASGKSHLARLWQARTGATLMEAGTLGQVMPMPGAHAAVVIENMENLPRSAEEAVFHLHNHLAASGGRLLMTSVSPPARWTVGLPDLASRLQASAVVRLGEPDDRLLAAVLTKLFADRQLSPPPAVIATLVARMERSFQAATQIVAELDDAALSGHRDINRSLIREILHKIAATAR